MLGFVNLAVIVHKLRISLGSMKVLLGMASFAQGLALVTTDLESDLEIESSEDKHVLPRRKLIRPIND